MTPDQEQAVDEIMARYLKEAEGRRWVARTWMIDLLAEAGSSRDDAAWITDASLARIGRAADTGPENGAEGQAGQPDPPEVPPHAQVTERNADAPEQRTIQMTDYMTTPPGAYDATVHGMNGANGNAQPDGGDNRPPRPGLDPLVSMVLRYNEFARDGGGELFLLPNHRMRQEPYIPRSFLARDVLHLGHVYWRGMARQWNRYVDGLAEDERKRLGVTLSALTPSDTVVRNAVAHLEALGMRDGRMVTASLRAVRVQDGRAIVIDLGDDTGRVVYVNDSGWRVCDPRELPCPPPVFRRSVGYLPLPEPLRGGNLDELWGILRVSRGTDDGSALTALAGGWLTAAYFADVPRPGLWITGVPGSGKTTTGGGIARLIDGIDWLGGKLDKGDERNNIIRAVKCYVPTFDNMTAVTGDLSDWVCTLVTGHKDMFRRMRTNFDDISMSYKRTFVATGLELPHGLNADALDRIIEVRVNRITEAHRVSDAQIRRELDAARGRLLGAVLDHVSSVLKYLAYIPPDQAGLPRMNDYARILSAHDQAHGTRWLDAYRESLSASRQDKAVSEPVVAALLGWLGKGKWWMGKPQDLFDSLGAYRPVDGWWPPDARSLSVNLTKNDGVLTDLGIYVFRSPDRRQICLKRPDPDGNVSW